LSSGNTLVSGNALGSAQPNRRTSQRDQREVNGREVNGRESNGLLGRELNGREATHPYAYKSNGITYGRHSPNTMPHLLDMNVGSESYLQGQTQGGNLKNRAAETNGFDMQRGDEDGGDGRKGFWGKFCC
jgi:hypothetical protein